MKIIIKILALILFAISIACSVTQKSKVEKKEADKTQIAKKRNYPLELEAALVYQSGEVVPVTRTTFYILDKDAIHILRDAKVKPVSASSERLFRDKLTTTADKLAFSLVYASQFSASKYKQEVRRESRQFLERVDLAIAPHMINKTASDFKGKATFEEIVEGSYFLYGIGVVRESYVVWNMPLKVYKSQKVLLDQNNAIFTF